MASQGHRPPSLTPSVKAAFMRQGLCFRCGVKGHIAKVCQGHTTQFSMNKAVQTTSLTADGRYCVQNGLCFRCKQPGHKQDDLKSCPEGHRAIFPFLKLAREVRNLVYEHYDLDWNKSVEFVRKEVNNHYFNIRQGRVPAVPPPLPCFKRTPKILLLNRQITSEALEGLRKKPLIFNLHDHDDYYVFGGSLYHPNHFFGAIGLNTLRCVPQIEFHFNREILLAASDIVRRFCIIISRTNIVHIPLRIVIGDGNSIYNYTNGAWHYVMFSHYLDEMFLRREKYHSDIYVVEVEALDRV
ncbi:MAG: hypothetical protein M1820_007003 [Bogoriella megaspora]|nr:MAG: hypothetical protein M1820_007003 [Bogoriella megaspora]